MGSKFITNGNLTHLYTGIPLPKSIFKTKPLKINDISSLTLVLSMIIDEKRKKQKKTLMISFSSVITNFVTSLVSGTIEHFSTHLAMSKPLMIEKKLFLIYNVSCVI